MTADARRQQVIKLGEYERREEKGALPAGNNRGTSWVMPLARVNRRKDSAGVDQQHVSDRRRPRRRPVLPAPYRHVPTGRVLRSGRAAVSDEDRRRHWWRAQYHSVDIRASHT